MVRIDEDVYNRYVELGHKVDEYFDNAEMRLWRCRFTQKHAFPTVEELEEHNVRENIEKYLPYLIYYAEIYESDNEEYQRTRQFLRKLLRENVEICFVREDRTMLAEELIDEVYDAIKPVIEEQIAAESTGEDETEREPLPSAYVEDKKQVVYLFGDDVGGKIFFCDLFAHGLSGKILQDFPSLKPEVSVSKEERARRRGTPIPKQTIAKLVMPKNWEYIDASGRRTLPVKGKNMIVCIRVSDAKGSEDKSLALKDGTIGEDIYIFFILTSGDGEKVAKCLLDSASEKVYRIDRLDTERLA